MRKLIAFLGLLGVIYALALQHGAFDRAAAPALPVAQARADPQLAPRCDEDTLASAYRNHESRVEVCGHAVIAKVLKDDTQGARHQRFILRLASGQTVLVAYNFDLAPRIDGLRAGAPLEFAGEYEWNAQGGVVHWTHRDPAGHHPPATERRAREPPAGGWIRYGGHLYR